MAIGDEQTPDRTEPIDVPKVLQDLRSPARMTALEFVGIRVEVFVPWHPFRHEVLRRSPRKDLGGRRIKVHAPEDLVVFKMVFGRSKDVEDFKAMLTANVGGLDVERIRSNARTLLEADGVEELEALIRDFSR
jgi:predicted nucleotidyltransferase